jgi:hypothetical protein
VSWRERVVVLIIVYTVFMILGDIADYFIGLVVEHYWPQASLTVFLVLYFVFLWLAWLIAIRVTAPKTAASAAG